MPPPEPGAGEPPVAPCDSDGSGARLTATDFARRFEASGRVLWAVAVGVLGDRSQVDDVLQEAAVIALGKLDRFQPGTSFEAWMGAIVRNVALNAGRKHQRRATHATPPEVLGELVDGAPPAQAGAAGPAPVDGRGALDPDQQAFDDEVLAALQTLAPIARAALLLRAVLDLSYPEIATALGIPAGTAMSHVHRSRQALRERLGTHEMERGA
jgi:RNA polymerase sigma-70 factor (ECF subfamily)